MISRQIADAICSQGPQYQVLLQDLLPISVTFCRF